MPDADAFEEQSPEQAFSLLGNETRIAILWAIHEADESVPFSDLRERVGVRDSGQFNYHLDKLAGTFVRKTESGYELTFAGLRVVGAILAGTYTKQGSLDPFEIDSRCRACESQVEVDYSEERVTVRCPTCDDQLSAFGFPPGGVEGRMNDELSETFIRWMRGVFSLMVGGICPNCMGPMTTGFVTGSEHVADDVGVEFDCQRCSERAYSSLGSYALYHPVVVAFHHDHGIDLNETPWWELAWLRNGSPTVRSEEPWEIEMTLELDGDTLDISIDDELTVTAE